MKFIKNLNKSKAIASLIENAFAGRSYALVMYQLYNKYCDEDIDIADIAKLAKQINEKEINVRIAIDYMLDNKILYNTSEVLDNQVSLDIIETPTNTNNTTSKCDKQELSKKAEMLWSIYPNKQGKKQSIPKIVKLIEKYGYSALAIANDRYIEHLEKEKWKKPMNGSTWFNGRVEDFLDGNYNPQSMGTETSLYEKLGKVEEQLKKMT